MIYIWTSSSEFEAKSSRLSGLQCNIDIMHDRVLDSHQTRLLLITCNLPHREYCNMRNTKSRRGRIIVVVQKSLIVIVIIIIIIYLPLTKQNGDDWPDVDVDGTGTGTGWDSSWYHYQKHITCQSSFYCMHACMWSILHANTCILSCPTAVRLFAFLPRKYQY